MFFHKNGNGKDPEDGRKEIRELIEVKKEATKYVADVLSSIERRYHDVNVVIDRRKNLESV